MSLSTAFLAAERDRAAVRRDARGAALVASRRRPTTSRDRPSVGWRPDPRSGRLVSNGSTIEIREEGAVVAQWNFPFVAGGVRGEQRLS